MSVYRGVRGGTACVVTVSGKALPLCRELADHAAAFDWGAASDGSTQLALAVLAHHAGPAVALSVYRKFAAAVVRGLPVEAWTLTGDDVDLALAILEAQPNSGRVALLPTK